MKVQLNHLNHYDISVKIGLSRLKQGNVFVQVTAITVEPVLKAFCIRIPCASTTVSHYSYVLSVETEF